MGGSAIVERMTGDREERRRHLERFMDAPTAENLATLQASLAEYQTKWINLHAGVPSGDGGSAAKPAVSSSRAPKLATSEREVLARLADGERLTIADVTRWAWFEDRELVRLQAEGEDEVLILTDLGRAALV